MPRKPKYTLETFAQEFAKKTVLMMHMHGEIHGLHKYAKAKGWTDSDKIDAIRAAFAKIDPRLGEEIGEILDQSAQIMREFEQRKAQRESETQTQGDGV